MEENKFDISRLQAMERDILKKYIEAVEAMGLRYVVIGGTLLGAVRHRGFIPWDDDIDVCMPREDYEKFIREGQRYLSEGLFLQTYETDPEYHRVAAKIRRSDTTFIEGSIRHLKINHGVFIDIFPTDIHSDKKANSLPVRIKKLLIKARVSEVYQGGKGSLRLRAACTVSKLFYPTVRDALIAKDAVCQISREGDKLANYSGTWGAKEIFPAEWFRDTVELEFEGLTVRAPIDYDKWLTQLYGDYMQLPPPEKRVSHHHTDIIDLDKPYTEYINK